MHEIIILCITYIAVIITLIVADFTIVLKELEVFKYIKIGYLKFVFNRKHNYTLFSKTYNTLKYYHNYQLPVILDN